MNDLPQDDRVLTGLLASAFDVDTDRLSDELFDEVLGDEDEWDDDEDDWDDWEDDWDEITDDESYYDVENPLYEVTCPKCGEVVMLDEESLFSENCRCPNCGTRFELVDDLTDEEE